MSTDELISKISQRNLTKIDRLIIDLYSAELQNNACINNNFTNLSEKGYQIFLIKDKKYNFIKNYFNGIKEIFISNGKSNNFYGTCMNSDVISKLNETHKFYDDPGEACNQFLKKYIESIQEDIEKQINSYFKIVNVRAFAALKNKTYGPTAFHTDNGPRFERKLMIYPRPLNKENGTLKLFDRDGRIKEFNTKYPAAILFDSSTLKHRGVPPLKKSFRQVIEITLIPSDKTEIRIVYEGQDARNLKFQGIDFPKKYSDYRNYLLKRLSDSSFATNVPSKREIIQISVKKFKNKNLIYRIIHNAWRMRLNLLFEKVYLHFFTKEVSKVYNTARNINLGGGFKFNYNSWLNFDECNEKNIGSLVDLSKFDFMPVSQGTIRKLYSSHFLEHITDEGVEKILKDTKRVLSKNGILILKIPDFNKYLEIGLNDDFKFCKRNIGPFTKTWRNKNVNLNAKNMASNLFASYWNKDYGNPFQRSGRVRGNNPYRGPAVINEKKLDELFKTKDIHLISKKLTSFIKNEKDFGGFNHQNAWSRDQFKQLLINNGYKIISDNKYLITLRYLGIPAILNMFTWSYYVVAKPIKKY